jgi:hypothetical protein
VSRCAIRLAAVKNGANAAILVTDLLAADGPAAAIAEDFIASRCSTCARHDVDDMRFGGSGYLCPRCGATAAAGAG